MTAYPSMKEMRGLVTPEQLAEKVSELGQYQKRSSIATLNDSILTPKILRAWAALVEAVEAAHPNDVVEVTTNSITRQLSTEEMEDVVLNLMANEVYQARKAEGK
jgi:hypothetical protein